MKDALSEQHEAEAEGGMTIGPNGKPVLSPEASAKKLERERKVAAEVRSHSFHLSGPFPLSLTLEAGEMRVR